MSFVITIISPELLFKSASSSVTLFSVSRSSSVAVSSVWTTWKLVLIRAVFVKDLCANSIILKQLEQSLNIYWLCLILLFLLLLQ